MKKAELKQLVAEALSYAAPVSKNDLDATEVHECANVIVDRIADKLVLKKVGWCSGSIDNSPSHEIMWESYFAPSWEHYTHEDFRPMNEGESIEDYYNAYYEWVTEEDEGRLGFDNANWFGWETFNLLEDSEEI